MTQKEIEYFAKEFLEGKTIKEVRYTEEQGENMLIPTIELVGGTILYIQNDDEGNTSGTIHTNIENHMVLMPQINAPKEI